MTQAISLAQMLTQAGHTVVSALVGVANERPVPAFFIEQMPAPVETVVSPILVYSARTNELRPWRTVGRNMRWIPKYSRSIRRIRAVLAQTKPDIIVNFYEHLGGLMFLFSAPDVPMVCISHQYLMLHPDFPHPKGQPVSHLMLTLTTRLTCIGATELLSLSFDQQSDQPKLKSRVVPPLLRQEVLNRKPTTESFLLAYTTQPGLMRQLMNAHKEHLELPIHAFYAGTTASDEAVDETLTYHAIDGKRFLDFMERSRAVVTTAGFESVCEAIYLGKPALLIPQPNHYEQACNAIDGLRIGAGVVADGFDLDKLLAYLPTYDQSLSERFRAWHAQGYYLFLNALNRVIDQHTGSTVSSSTMVSDLPQS